MVYGALELDVITDPEELKRSPLGKPFLRLSTPDKKIILDITTNIGEMIGGAAKGTRERWENRG